MAMQSSDPLMAGRIRSAMDGQFTGWMATGLLVIGTTFQVGQWVVTGQWGWPEWILAAVTFLWVGAIIWTEVSLWWQYRDRPTAS